MSRPLHLTMADLEAAGSTPSVIGYEYYDRTLGQATTEVDHQRMEIVAKIAVEIAFIVGFAAWSASEAGIPLPLTAGMMAKRTLLIYSLTQKLMQLSLAVTTPDADLQSVNTTFDYLSLTSRSVAAGAAISGWSTSPKTVSAMNSIFDLGVKSYGIYKNPSSPRAAAELVKSQYSAWKKLGDALKEPVNGSDVGDVHLPRDSFKEPSVTAEPPTPSDPLRRTPKDFGLSESDTSGDEDVDTRGPTAKAHARDTFEGTYDGGHKEIPVGGIP